MNPVQVVQLSKSLRKAFADDDFCRYITPKTDRRETHLEWWMSILLRYTDRYGKVLVSPDGRSAAALWMGPEQPIVSTAKIIAMGLFKVPFTMGFKSFRRILEITGQWDRIHHALPKRHFYLMILGVDPALQKQGVGKSLVTPVLAQADQLSLLCYLETAKAENVPYYRKLGFEITHEATVQAPEGNWKYWTMVRKPQTA